MSKLLSLRYVEQISFPSGSVGWLFLESYETRKQLCRKAAQLFHVDVGGTYNKPNALKELNHNKHGGPS